MADRKLPMWGMPLFLFGSKCVLFRESDCLTAQKHDVSYPELVAHGTYADPFPTTSSKSD